MSSYMTNTVQSFSFSFPLSLDSPGIRCKLSMQEPAELDFSAPSWDRVPEKGYGKRESGHASLYLSQSQVTGVSGAYEGEKEVVRLESPECINRFYTMSLARVALGCIQAACYQVASTPPNKTPSKGRFDVKWHSRISPLVFTIQRPLVWMCTLADIVLVLAQQQYFPLPSPLSNFILTTLCPSNKISPLRAASLSTRLAGPDIRVTQFTILGVTLVALGMLLRLSCYKALGTLFTFDLTILPAHKLITSGPYGYVRHPAYTGSLLAFLGIILVNLTPGGWIVECEVLGSGVSGTTLRMGLFLAMYGYWLAVGVSRARAEDTELRKMFGKEWDCYATEVPYWFVPGLI